MPTFLIPPKKVPEPVESPSNTEKEVYQKQQSKSSFQPSKQKNKEQQKQEQTSFLGLLLQEVVDEMEQQMEKALQHESVKRIYGHTRENGAKKVVTSQEKEQVISQLSEDSILSIIEELAVDNAEVEDLFRQILQRVEEELILDQFRNL